MKFKLRIPGRDEIQAVPVANPANPLIQIGAIKRLAEIAANDAPDPAPALVPISRLAGLAAHEIGNAEIVRFEKRQARISSLGYGDDAEHLAEMLLHRDRDLDDRRLCVECSHAGVGWRCAKRDAFLVRQLQRCNHFKEITQ